MREKNRKLKVVSEREGEKCECEKLIAETKCLARGKIV